MPRRLAAVKEIAAALGISTQRVYQLVNENRDFPEPVAVLSVGRIWDMAEIERWAKKRR